MPTPVTSTLGTIVPAIFSAVAGIAYAASHPRRFGAPMFDGAKELFSIQTWGLLMIIGGIAMSVALVSRRNVAVTATFFFGGVFYAWWACLFGLTAIENPLASPAAPALWAFVSIYHFIIAEHAWRTR